MPTASVPLVFLWDLPCVLAVDLAVRWIKDGPIFPFSTLAYICCRLPDMGLHFCGALGRLPSFVGPESALDLRRTRYT